MPYRYKRKTTKNSWSEDNLAKAMQLVKRKNYSFRRAAQEHGIPESTLRKKLKTGCLKKCRFGRNPILNSAQETEITNHVLQLSKMYYGITQKELRKLAYDFAKANKIPNHFNNITKLAGKDWLRGFLKRNISISLRQPEATSLNRITAFNPAEVSLFYNNLENVMRKFSFAPHRIFNVDETGMTCVQQKCAKIYALKGSNRVGAITSAERGRTITGIFCASASGAYVPPMLIFPRKRMDERLKRNGPSGAEYKCSKNGWTNSEIHIEWLQHFQAHVKSVADDPVLLVLDNHCSHVSLDAYNFYKQHSMEVVTLPPHTSHRTQPLDLSFFRPLKSALSMEIKLYLSQHPFQKVTEYNIAELLNKAWNKVATPGKAVTGFRSAGIYPLNRHRFEADEFFYFNKQPDCKTNNQNGTTADTVRLYAHWKKLL